MAIDISEYLKMIPAVMHAPTRFLWASYDEKADVVYFNFKKPCISDDSELTDDDVIVRYENEEVVGLTVLNASQRIT